MRKQRRERSFSPLTFRHLFRQSFRHLFRHSFATHCAENGMDLFTPKKLMGHAFLETTELYVATSMEKARKEYEGSHELMGWLRSDLNQPIRDNRL
ncbi:MAG: tyrosine-type recombinase/integrase [Candidatus Xenobiia bacterium LiM19]